MIDDFLSLLEKTVKIDVRYFLKNQVFLSSATLVNILSGFVLSILFARYVSQNTFGQYSFIFFLIATLEFTGLTGLRSMLPFAISQGRDKFYTTSIKLTFLGSLLGLLILLITALYYSFPGKPYLSPTLIMAAFFFPFVTAFSLYSGFFTGKKMFFRNSIYAGLQAIVPNVLIALAIFYKPETFWLVFAGLFGQAILNLLFTYNSFTFIQKSSELLSDVRYGLKLSFVWLVSMAFKHLDKIVLAKLLGFEGVAIYTFAILIPQQISNFLKNIQPLAIFKMSGLSPSEIRSNLPRKSLQLMVLIIPLVVAYIVLSPYLFNYLYPAYSKSILPSQIYALGLVFFPTTILAQSFHHLKQLSKMTTFSLVTPALRLILVVFFVQRFGLVGAAWAFVVYSFLEFLVVFALVSKK